MKATMVLLFSLVCMIMAQKYPNKYDNNNIETVLSNDRVLTNYIKCLLDKGACTPEGKELKSEYIENGQKHLIDDLQHNNMGVSVFRAKNVN